MPGLHTLVSLRDNGPEQVSRRRDLFKATLQKMSHYPNYATELLIDSDSLMLGLSAYPHYPLKVFDTGDRTIVVEGKVYNVDEQYLTDMLSTLSLKPQDLENELARFLPNADGEFIIQMYDREQNIYLLFNDALARLPFYYHSSSSYVVISREVKFITPFLDKVTFSRDALAEYLLFGYPWGKKTLVDNVYRLSPATLLLMDIEKHSFLSQPVLLWNLDSKPVKQDELNKTVDKLAATFLDSLKHRTDSFAGYTPVVSLSGGYDSRTVLAGLTKVQANPIAMTISNRECAYEIPLAKEVCHRLSTKHRIIPVSSALEQNLEEMKLIAYLKDGLNYVAMSHILKFYSTVASDLGSRIVGYTGLGGNTTMDPLRFNRSINSLEQLSRFICATNAVFSLGEASLLLGVDKKKLSQNLEAHLSSYSEQTFEGKYRHFKAFEKGLGSTVQGESRNRFFFWHTTPFFSVPFFTEAIRLPELIKKDGALYRSFRSKIDAGCAELGRPGGTMSIVGKVRDRLFQSLPIWAILLITPVVKKVMTVSKKEQGIGAIRSISLETLDRCQAGKHYFNAERTRKAIANEKDRVKLFTLLTLLLYIELVEDRPPDF